MSGWKERTIGMTVAWIARSQPASASNVAKDSRAASAGRSMPFRITPCVLGYWPVSIVARAGWQNGFCVRHCAKRVPAAASRSRFGVAPSGSP